MPRQKVEVKFGREWTLRIEVRIAGDLKGYLWATKNGVYWQRAGTRHPKRKSWQQFDEWMNGSE